MFAGNTLNRMIFIELVKVFLLSLGSLTGLFLLAGIIQQAMQLGLSPGQIVAAVPLFVPFTLPYTIPATTLFASCVVYGRLAHDNEVVAIKGAGVHLFSLLTPALMLGVITTAVTAALFHTVIPRSQQMLQEELLKDPEEALYSTLRREKSIRHPSADYVLFVRDVQGRRLIDVVLKQKAKPDKTGAIPPNGYDYVFRAQTAQLRVDAAEGMMYIDPDRFMVYNPNTQGTSALNAPIPVKLPDNFNAQDARTRPSALTWKEIGPRLETLRRDRDAKIAERDAARAKTANIPDEATRVLALAQESHYKAQIENCSRLMVNVESEYHMRPALALGCIVFALIGCPVGIWATRADYLSTFVICFLPTVLVYYPLIFAGSNLGRDGKIPLVLGWYLADITIGMLGLVLIWRLLKR
ncbi:MAG: LptF/LptG family permease [Gemmataceae bacterium]